MIVKNYGGEFLKQHIYKQIYKEQLIMRYLAKGSLLFGTLTFLIVSLFYIQPTAEAVTVAIESQNSQPELIQQNLIQNDQQQDDKQTVKQDDQDDQDEISVEVEVDSDESAAILAARTFKATAYCLRGKTASGSHVRQGIVAADTRLLPLGTRIRMNAGKYSGTYTVADTGGRIKGRILDVWVPSCSEARRFGRKNVKVSVVKRKKRRNKG